ncbi:zona pellucida sperm-binding protein 3-like [Triplophysa dalaica]|uniref:zona pellucida sperm-binding protein 3-like n=1 Tax=Triplophysa dalaica TaxID=1582913 RepID=UPI0024DF842B|nr:zona pellucida sperm-binding protein 3-like [Triplophysa dalaica]XP_056612867.1 zona pellucida sperm-binding protein 3-like [Triplophysa dalaica]XP_056612870.1 zona pellucida sperm-binding protein 3-like [Triplophysa dalaica]
MKVLWQAGVGLVLVLAFGLSDAQWRGRSAQTQKPSTFRPWSQMQVTQQSETRMPPSPQTNNPMLVPQRFPSQFSMQTPGVVGGKPGQDPLGVQSKQLLQGPMGKLMWTFPSLPEEPVQPEIPFELRNPLSPNSVGAQCGENSVYVEVMEDFFGTGQLLMASGFALGGCGPTGQDNNARVLLFESELHGCGSMLTVTEDELVYVFSLVYTPQEFSNGVPIVRSSGAVVSIECHYPRMHNVSSNVLVPTWLPYAATKVAEERLVFSLKLMTDEWQFERPSNQYFLGDIVNIEASVKTYNHVPLRVFVDRCVATASPDVNSAPKYSFIENNGCLVDAKYTGSSSRYLPRTQIDKLQFQLEAFRFEQVNSGLVYITCILKAVPVATATNSEQKACSFSPNGWVSVDESDQVCGCCDSTCSSSSSASDQVLGDLRWEQASVGPLNVKEFGFGRL